MRLLCLNPNGSATTTDVIRGVADSWAHEHPGCTVVTRYLPGAPELLVTQDDSDAVAGRVREQIRDLPALGFDAMVVACHGDPGLPVGREDSSIPVVGVGWASMATAASTGSWGVICISPAIADDKIGQAVRYGLGAPDYLVGAGRNDYETASPAAAADLTAIVDGMVARGIRSTVLGCATMSALAPTVRERTGADVIEPIAAGLDAAIRLLARRMPGAVLPAAR
ncbi:hypothetical protein GCM10009785_29950 [Brooklawnia cerclae]|uniref:Asp/Glu/hydantoin racemase n=1 Tax=Brooklawnia cerclae TaxID=349934 RepID=A0ABX0SFP2_9ACTN|nr:Asp/Glu/hydantoin racemase [Brooklawnia cerclae]